MKYPNGEEYNGKFYKGVKQGKGIYLNFSIIKKKAMGNIISKMGAITMANLKPMKS